MLKIFLYFKVMSSFTSKKLWKKTLKTLVISFYHVLLFLLVESAMHAANLPPNKSLPAGDSTIVIETFDYPKQIGKFPKTWEGRYGWRQARARLKDIYYTIESEIDNLFLRASTEGKAINVGIQVNIILRTYNRVRWRWRVFELPKEGNEKIEERNDSAAAVRLIFKGGVIPKTIKYVWSTTLPTGTETESPLNSKTKIIVLDSGKTNLGQWVWKDVNAYEDYRRLFGGEPRPVRAIAILTDSDNTQSTVKADYDDITFFMAPPDTFEMVPDFHLKSKEKK